MTTSEVKNCHRCLLRESCGQVVAGQGSANSKLVLVGLAPGREEDLEGEPFVGRWNQLLKIILTKACIEPNLVYRTYLVKCCPSATRIPTKSVLECKYWLWKELTLIKPKVVVPLGLIPAKTLLKTKLLPGQKTFVLEDWTGRQLEVDYMASIVCPWYSLDTILKEGKTLREETITFFSNIRKMLL